ncbi:LemA family protein [Treponema sp.]|uniref:LemA family protein n=1 Tax=Treponema sp. TaxID=166 RepID=UPI001E00A78E|nr:LemA family protein [Treponema sp.]MBS7241546.1 LemA family protein [Treponema sp.]MCI6441845.1 LemA family protein [Spirochaetia bacterium]MDY4132445.1 LemA family protein [Treponema sp.]
MKKIVTIIGVAFASLFMFTGCGYNGIVSQKEAVEQQWANVENQYQKRADLVPNLVATVKGFAKHEEKVFTELAEARSKLGGTVSVDASITDDPEKLAQFQKTQRELGAGLGRLLALTENYPELKSNANFLDLQSQLEGIENRIATERKRYNDAVGAYNKSIQMFPGVITAKMFHFEKKAYFQAEEGTQKAPAVSFD